MKYLEVEGKRKYYRNPESRKDDKKKNKKRKNNWYKNGNVKESITSVMFVETTPQGELIKLLKSIEEKYKIGEEQRIKFVEKCGTKVINKLRVADPFRSNCREDDCLACRGSKEFSNCRKMNIGYTLQCETCKSKGTNRVYRGESSRNLYLRGKEHESLYRNKNKNSVMWKHVTKEHEKDKENVKFQMKMTGVFLKPLQRIINEGIMIKRTKPEELLNTKQEYYGPSLKRRTYS